MMLLLDCRLQMTAEGLECIDRFQALTYLSFSICYLVNIPGRMHVVENRVPYKTMAKLASLCHLQHLRVDGFITLSPAEAEALPCGFPALRDLKVIDLPAIFWAARPDVTRLNDDMRSRMPTSYYDAISKRGLWLPSL